MIIDIGGIVDRHSVLYLHYYLVVDVSSELISACDKSQVGARNTIFTLKQTHNIMTMIVLSSCIRVRSYLQTLSGIAHCCRRRSLGPSRRIANDVPAGIGYIDRKTLSTPYTTPVAANPGDPETILYCPRRTHHLQCVRDKKNTI